MYWAQARWKRGARLVRAAAGDEHRLVLVLLEVPRLHARGAQQQLAVGVVQHELLRADRVLARREVHGAGGVARRGEEVAKGGEEGAQLVEVAPRPDVPHRAGALRAATISPCGRPCGSARTDGAAVQLAARRKATCGLGGGAPGTRGRATAAECAARAARRPPAAAAGAAPR